MQTIINQFLIRFDLIACVLICLATFFQGSFSCMYLFPFLDRSITSNKASRNLNSSIRFSTFVFAVSISSIKALVSIIHYIIHEASELCRCIIYASTPMCGLQNFRISKPAHCYFFPGNLSR